jgi:hypothetical protein
MGMQRALTFLLLLGLARSLSFQAAQDSTIYDRRRLYSSGKVLNLRSLQKMRVTVTLTRDTADTFTTEKQAALLAAFKAKNIYKLHQDQDGGEFPPRSDVIERKITAISTLNGNEVVRCSRPRGKYPCLLWNSQAKESGLKIYFELSASRPVMHFILSAIENGEMAVWLRDQLISVDGLNEYVSFSIPAGPCLSSVAPSRARAHAHHSRPCANATRSSHSQRHRLSKRQDEAASH